MIRELFQFQQVFVDGRGYAGVASAVEVPKVEALTREFRAGGMSGPVKVRQAGHGLLTATITFQGFDPELYLHFGITEAALIPFTVKGSTQDIDGKAHAHAIKMHGFISKFDEGEWKEGEEVPLKLDLDLRYYRRERDGVELIEADPINMVFRVNGVDQLAQHRANIGR